MAVGWGDILLKIQFGKRGLKLELQNVLHDPSFQHSLISVCITDTRGVKVNFESGFCSLNFDNHNVAKTQLHSSLYILQAINNQNCIESALVTNAQR